MRFVLIDGADPVAITGADRIEQTIPEHRPGKVEAQRIAAVTADGIDPVALDDAVQARRNVTDRFLVRRFDIAIADTLHRPRQALWMIDYLCRRLRSEEHTSELQSLMRISYAVFCLKKKN